MTSEDASRLVKNWNRIHAETSRALRAAPERLLEWRPKEGMFTMRELLGHITQAAEVLARSALAGSDQKPTSDISNKTAEEIIKVFDRQHDELAAEVLKLSSEQLNEEVEFHGRRLRRSALLWFITEHEIHHRGQLFTYYRLADVEPPNLHE